MSNSTLNNTVNGRLAIRDVFRWAAEWRDSRRLRRAWNKFYRNWYFGDHATKFSQGFGAIVAELNAAHDLDQQAFRILGARYGASPESVQDEVYYVDPVNGSDTSGNGTTDHPYASLWFLPYFLPKRIDHQYRVVIRADLSMETMQINQEFGPDGSLAFIGEGAAIVGDSRTVDAGIATYDGFEHIPMTVGGLSDDQYTGFFMQNQADDQAHPIWYHNAAGEFKTPIGWSGSSPDPADVVSFVRPAIRLTIAGISIGGSSPMMARDSGGTIYGSRIGFFNLDIDVRSTAKYPAINLQSLSGVSMSFTRVLYDNSTVRPLQVNGTDINPWFHLDPDIETYAQSGISNIARVALPGASVPAGLIMLNTDGLGGGNVAVRVLGKSLIRGLSLRNAVSVEEGSAAILDSSATNTLNIRDSNVFLDNVGLGYIDEGNTVNLNTGGLRWSAVSFFCWGGAGVAGSMIVVGGSITNPGSATIGGLSVDIADSAAGSWAGYGVETYCPSFLFFRPVPALLTGGANDILFSTPAVPVPAAWPAAGAAVNDGLGTSVASVHA